MNTVTSIKKMTFVFLAALLTLACDNTTPPKAVTAVQPVDAPINKSTSVARRKKAKEPGLVVSQKTLAAVNDFSAPQTDGKPFKFADLRGKVVLVDVWATFCGPCREQAPKLAELSKKYRDKGLEVVGLNIDDANDQNLVKAFIKQAGINYKVVYATEPLQSAFLDGTEDETGGAPIPQLYVVSRDGKVVEHLIGSDPRHSIAQLEEVITKQLN